jgi:hypothetical protein
MPVELLSDDQVAAYGGFNGPPAWAQLERFFFLDAVDRALVDQRRGDHNRLGFAIQGTVRFLGAFLADPLDAVAYVAEQLGITELACFKHYPHGYRLSMSMPVRSAGSTATATRRGSRRAQGVPDRSAVDLERHGAVLIGRATAWLIDRLVLLSGARTLAKLVAAVRAEAAERLWRMLADGTARALGWSGCSMSGRDLGSRPWSACAPVRPRASGPEMVRALERATEVGAVWAPARWMSRACLPAGWPCWLGTA